MATKNAPRVYININGEDTLVTNSLMMTFAVDALREVGAPVEIIAKAETHLAQLNKKPSGAPTVSRAAKENAALAARVLEWMPQNEAVTARDIVEHVNGIMTSQKCTKVMQILIGAGKVRRIEKVNGRSVGYELV